MVRVDHTIASKTDKAYQSRSHNMTPRGVEEIFFSGLDTNKL